MSGKYNTVTCIDVMIHYPTDKMQDMVSHLASLSDERLFVSFAPKVRTLPYEATVMSLALCIFSPSLQSSQL